MYPVIGGVGDLVNLVSKLGELAGGLAAHILKHMGRQNKFVAVGDVGVDEVVQQRPFQTGAHACVHPVSGTGQLHAPLVVDETQILAQIHMVLWLKVKGVLLADVAQGLVVLLAAGQQIGVGHIGQAQHGGAKFGVQHLQLFSVIGNLSIQPDGLGLVGFNLSVQSSGILAPLFHALLLAEEFAVFLGQLILLGGCRLGGGLQTPDFYIQLQNPVNGGIAVHFLGLETGLNCIGIFLDTFDV